MPYDDAEDHGGGGGDDDEHKDLQIFADALLRGFELSADLSGKCMFCTQPRLLRALVLQMFVEGYEKGLKMKDTMEMIEAAANLARAEAKIIIRDRKKAEG